MDQVVLLADREVAADGPRRGGGAVGRPQHPAHDRDRLVPLEHADDHRRARDELDQPLEKRLALVLGVMFLGQAAIDADQLERRDPQALGFETLEDRADQAGAGRNRV